MPDIVTDDALARAAHDAGFRDQSLVTAVAIALAESGGDAEAVNDTRGQNVPAGVSQELSIGAWQIDTLVWTQFTPADMLNLAQNALAAYAVFRAQGFEAWSTYKNGAYEQYVSRAQAAVNGDPHIQSYTQLYVVQPGDTLSGIAQTLWGDAARYPEIAAANNVTDPDHIEAGQVLQIPPADGSSYEPAPPALMAQVAAVAGGNTQTVPDVTPIDAAEQALREAAAIKPTDTVAEAVADALGWARVCSEVIASYIAFFEGQTADTRTAAILPKLYTLRDAYAAIEKDA